MVWRLSFLLLVFLPGITFGASIDAKNAYYGRGFPEVVRKGGEPLREALFFILRGGHTPQSGDFDLVTEHCLNGMTGCYQHTAVGYKRAREILFGDLYLVKRGQEYAVKEMYCQRVVGAAEFPGEKPGPNQIPDHTVINAEHTWPQSLFNRAMPAEDQKSDLHHLFPTDPEMNSRRSSFRFGMVASAAEPLKCSESRLGHPRLGNATVFEPPTPHRGNVARAVFYFSVRYKLRIDEEEEATLREWNRLDPVDQEEAAKNERIFQFQKNRNPFVDFPNLADSIRDF